MRFEEMPEEYSLSGSFWTNESIPHLTMESEDVSALEWVQLSRGTDGIAVGSPSGRVVLMRLSEDHSQFMEGIQEIWPPDFRIVFYLTCSEPQEGGEMPFLVAAKASSVMFWDVWGEQQVGTFPLAHIGSVSAMAWACDHVGGTQHLITGGLEGTLKVRR